MNDDLKPIAGVGVLGILVTGATIAFPEHFQVHYNRYLYAGLTCIGLSVILSLSYFFKKRRL